MMYDEKLLERSAHPRFQGSLSGVQNVQEFHLFNSSCGDQITIFLQIDPKSSRISDGRWQGQGCAISLTSADFFIESVIGKTILEAAELKAEFTKMILGQDYDPSKVAATQPLQLVSRLPARINCAKLPWQALSLTKY